MKIEENLAIVVPTIKCVRKWKMDEIKQHIDGQI